MQSNFITGSIWKVQIYFLRSTNNSWSLSMVLPRLSIQKGYEKRVNFRFPFNLSWNIAQKLFLSFIFLRFPFNFSDSTSLWIFRNTKKIPIMYKQLTSGGKQCNCIGVSNTVADISETSRTSNSHRGASNSRGVINRKGCQQQQEYQEQRTINGSRDPCSNSHVH